MKKYYSSIILFLIVSFAFFIRVYRLDLDIPTIYGDEAGGQYVALGTLTQPADLIHKVFYLLQNGAATLTWHFGLTPLGVRLPAAIYGSIAVLVIYYFCTGFAGKRTALVASAIAAISPWSFMLSRIGHTHLILMLIFVLLSIIFYLRSGSGKKNLMSFIFLSIAVYEYPSMIIIAPVIALYMLFEKTKKRIIIPTLLLTVISFCVFTFVYRGFSATARGLDLAIWNDVNVTAENNLYRGIAGESNLTSVFYNYPVSVIGAFVKNYLSFFSPDFLFLKGDPVLRHSTGQVGAFLLFTLPFMLYGAFKFFQRAKPRIRNYFLVWILVSPIPAAITNDGAGYLLRVYTLMPFLTYFIALGMVKSFKLFKTLPFKIIYAVLVASIALYSTCSFLYGYFTVYPALSAKSFEVGFKDLAIFQKENKDASILVVWHGFYPNMVFRFWQQTPFGEYEKFVPEEIKVGKSIFYKSFSNLYFSWPDSVQDLNSAVLKLKPEYLAIPASYTHKSSSPPIKTIKYPDQTTAFEIYQQ